MLGRSYKFKFIVAQEDLKLTLVQDTKEDSSEIENQPENLKFEMTLTTDEMKHFQELQTWLNGNKDSGNLNLITIGGKYSPEEENMDSDRSDSGSMLANDHNLKAKNLVKLPKPLGAYKFLGATNDDKIDFNFRGCVGVVSLNGYEFDLHGHEFLSGCNCYSCFLCNPNTNTDSNPIQPEVIRPEDITPFPTPEPIQPFTLKYESFAALEFDTHDDIHYPIEMNLQLQTLIGNGHVYYLSHKNSHLKWYISVYFKSGVINVQYEQVDLQRGMSDNYMIQTRDRYNNGETIELKIVLDLTNIQLQIFNDAGELLEPESQTAIQVPEGVSMDVIDYSAGSTTSNMKPSIHLGKLPGSEVPSYRGPRNGITAIVTKFNINGNQINPIENSLIMNEIDNDITSPIRSVSFDEHEGLVKIPGFELNVGDKFSIDFINHNVNGPIFYAFTVDEDGQWNSLLIRIVYRRVQVISTVGNVHRHDNAYKAYRLGSITHIVVSRTSPQILKITVNKRQNLEIISREWRKEKAPYKYDHVFIGGIQPDDVVEQTEKIFRPQIRIKNFDGCIMGMKVKDKKVDFNNALMVTGSANFKECKAKLTRHSRESLISSRKYKSAGSSGKDYYASHNGLIPGTGSSNGKSNKHQTCSRKYTYNLEKQAVQFGWKPDSYIIKRLTANHQKSMNKKFRLKLDVKTFADHGVLIYATKVSRGDYDIRLSLASGHVLLNIVAPGAKQTLKITSKRAINDGKWHTIYLHQQRKSRKIFMKIDKTRRAGIEKDVNLMKNFKFPKEIYFGGRPHATAYTSDKYKSPDACMRNIYVGRVPLDISNPSNCNFITGCGRKHEPGMFFPGSSGNHSKISNSYAEISDIFGSNNEFKTSFSFRSFEKDATIFETNEGVGSGQGQTSEKGLPYVIMKIVDGRVIIVVDDTTYLTNESQTICDGNWHDINMYISKSSVRIILDASYSLQPQNNKRARIEKLNFWEPNSTKDKTKPVLLIGAYYDRDTRNIVSDYRGCMKNFKITSNRSWRWKNIYMVTNQSCPVPGE